MDNNIIITFDLLYDTDLGLLKLIKSKYNNPEIVKREYLDNITDIAIIDILLKNKDKNPLSFIINDKYHNHIDSLYDDFFTNKYDEVLLYSPMTEIVNLISLYKMSKAISINVLCKNKLEEQAIKELNNEYNTILKEENKVSVEDYDSIYIKYINDINLFDHEHIKGKNIYIGNYSYNLQNDETMRPNNDFILSYGNVNKIYVIDVYKKLNPIG